MNLNEFKNMRKLKCPEVMQLLGISRRTLVRWDFEGKLVAKRTPSNRRFYTEDQIEELIKSMNKARTEEV